LNEEIRAGKQQFNRAFLVGVQIHPTPRTVVEDHLRELEALIDTLGVEVAAVEIVRLSRPSPQLLIGSGKAEEITTRMEALECDLLVFDDDLTPPQQSQWESKAKCAVIDRRKVIIDIFAQRAQTREARLQVELALLEYMMPRLKSAWTHLERQRGGRGFVGGAGEAQIEIDRRLVRDRIAILKREIGDVRRHRLNQRKQRQRRPVPTAAIVGYTNAGKSSLLNAMTKAGVLQEDKLFATLDPTTRRVTLPNNQPLLLTDTVGFIRKLPTTLIDAFKSTLEEATLADVLIHVIDISHPQAQEQYETTRAILKELGAEDKPCVVLLNKCDRLDSQATSRAIPTWIVEPAERILLTSTLNGEGLDTLAHLLGSLLNQTLAEIHLRVPASRFDIVSVVHREGEVLDERYDGSDVLIHALFPRQMLPQVTEWQESPTDAMAT
jgi:GTP-binding protein HflX